MARIFTLFCLIMEHNGRRCSHCNKRFTPLFKWQITCSRKCAMLGGRKEEIKEFYRIIDRKLGGKDVEKVDSEFP